MDKVALSSIIIELHVPNFQVVKDFYGKLGFGVVWEIAPKDEEGYLVIKMKNNILAFYCGNEEVYKHSYFKRFSKDTPRGYGTELAIYLEDGGIEQYYNDVLDKIDSKFVVQQLETKPWGSKDFRLVDPFGFYLCIREADNILIK